MCNEFQIGVWINEEDRPASLFEAEQLVGRVMEQIDEGVFLASGPVLDDMWKDEIYEICFGYATLEMPRP